MSSPETPGITGPARQASCAHSAQCSENYCSGLFCGYCGFCVGSTDEPKPRLALGMDVSCWGIYLESLDDHLRWQGPAAVADLI